MRHVATVRRNEHVGRHRQHEVHGSGQVGPPLDPCQLLLARQALLRLNLRK